VSDLDDLIGFRQWPVIEHLRTRIEAMDELLGAVLIGSFATGTADSLSDIDLFVVVKDGRFEEAWSRRRELGYEDDIFAWDVREATVAEVGAHKFITKDLVFAECLIATPASAASLADPCRVLAGPADLPGRVRRRPPIERAELGAKVRALQRVDELIESAGADLGSAIDRAYVTLISLLRRAAS
jgi:hypothetical protein